MLGHTANKRTAPEYAGAVCDLRRIYKNSRGLAASAQPMARPMCAPPKIRCHHSKVAGVSFSSPGLWQMTGRIISTLAVAIAIGPSLAYGSPACMTQSEARAKFPKVTHGPFAATPTTRRGAHALGSMRLSVCARLIAKPHCTAKGRASRCPIRKGRVNRNTKKNPIGGL